MHGIHEINKIHGTLKCILPRYIYGRLDPINVISLGIQIHPKSMKVWFCKSKPISICDYVFNDFQIQVTHDLTSSFDWGNCIMVVYLAINYIYTIIILYLQFSAGDYTEE